MLLLLLNPDGTPMEPTEGDPSLWVTVLHGAATAAVVGTVGLAIIYGLVILTQTKGLPIRRPKEFDYFIAATAGLWIFAIGGSLLT